ncbi:hypothetical protein [Anaerotruncus massiliensis (ex Liu et al. 2021)]|uniref:hypothetical protein n=1 Tax=Anaerotruncus massiliensis (ex Liu et al. 2021) TaxID=2321404 RepID=UPI003AF7A8BF
MVLDKTRGMCYGVEGKIYDFSEKSNKDYHNTSRAGCQAAARLFLSPFGRTSAGRKGRKLKKRRIHRMRRFL